MEAFGFKRWARLPRWLRPSMLLVAICAIGVVLAVPTRLDAQSNSSDPSQVLRNLLQGQGGNTNNIGNLGTGNGAGFPTSQQNSPLTLSPSLANSAPLPPSRLEQIMSQRASVKLNQFGYDLLGTGQTVTVPQTGGVSDNYILGPGDEIVVSFRGQENSEYTVTVDRNGHVVLPRLNPINVAGHTLGEFRQQLDAAVSRAYVSTRAFASVSQLRQVSVVVAGEVYNPGTRLVTGLSTAVDAILLSGGVKKTGSLRNVILERGNQRIRVDLYDLLTQRGGGGNQTLTDGDRVIVPSIGKTVAVAGWAKRPGIYELAPGTSQVSASVLLKLAGGLEVRGRYRLSVLRVQQDGSSKLEQLSNTGGVVRDSEILFVQPGADQTQTQATLSGATPLAGPYSVGRGASSLAEMLKAPGALGPTPYTLFGIVSRRDPRTMLRTLIPITPIAVVRGSENLSLLSDDIVRVFSDDENRLLTAVVDAFRKRRQEAEEMLRAPASADLYSNLPTTPASTATSSVATAGTAQPPKTPLQLLQQQEAAQTRGNQTPKTERQDIAELSTQTLGDGGLLTTNPPSNGYAPYSSSPANSPLQTNAPTSAPGVSSSSPSAASMSQNAVAAALLAQQNGQNTQFQQTLPDLLTDQNQNLPPNMQRQQIISGQVPTNEGIQTFGQLARQLSIDPLVLVHFLMDRSLTIDGAVHGPGTFFVGPNVTLQDLVTAAGGTSDWVDTKEIELISTQISALNASARTSHELVALNVPSQAGRLVRPHDEVRLHQFDTAVGAGSVTLQGQVRYPGVYQFQRGERLSELLLRAGGLTDVAYPYGTVFLRKSAADIERQSYARAARALENQIASGITMIGADKISPQALIDMQNFIDELRTTTPLGRISVIADPALLASDPSRDMLLESGDVIYVPQRSSTISVMGEVLQPGTFPFSTKMSAEDYVARAGGFNQFADKSLTFVVLPDGTARRLDRSWFNFDNPNVPPGSIIVVPRDAAILDTRQIILDITGIFRDLAVGAASLAVIARQ